MNLLSSLSLHSNKSNINCHTGFNLSITLWECDIVCEGIPCWKHVFEWTGLFSMSSVPACLCVAGVCSKHGLFPFPDDCTKFSQCMLGIKYTRACPTGTYFDPHIKSCGFKRDHCGTQELHPGHAGNNKGTSIWHEPANWDRHHQFAQHHPVPRKEEPKLKRQEGKVESKSLENKLASGNNSHSS